MGGCRGRIKSVKETGWEGSCGTSEARAESSWAQLMVVVEMEIDQQHISQAWGLTPVNPALGRQKQESTQ